MKNICIIPARGNSKRIKNKNIKKFNKIPIISFAIKAAKKTNLFDHIIVSTDNDEIANIAKEYGAEVPFVRPENLADDHSTTLSVIKHGIDISENLGWIFEHVCCVYPCVPLISFSDIIKSYKIMTSSIDLFVFPVSETNSNLYRSLGIKKNGELFSIFAENESKGTQELSKTFFDAGQFYWGHKELWKTSKNIHNNAKGYLIPKWKAVDIDNEEDWLMAELMYTNLKIRGEIE